MWSVTSLLIPVVYTIWVWAEGCGGTSAESLDTRITGGEEVNIQEFPYQVAIEGGNVLICGGSIISPKWVLTAAHCIQSAPAAWLRIRAGTSFYLRGGVIHKVTSTVWHHLYEDTYKDYDIGLILVTEPFRFSPFVQPIPLASGSVDPGQTVVVSGWGFLEQEQIHRPKQLMAVNLIVANWDICHQIYKFLSPRQMCAGGTDKDSCYGDSGGPLVYGNRQVGVVSTGYRCGFIGQPGIYTNISVIGSWVEQIMIRQQPDDQDSIVFPSDS